MAGHCGYSREVESTCFTLPQPLVRGSALQENCFRRKTPFCKGVSGPWASGVLRLPTTQGRGEGLRPCLDYDVSYTWVCGILFTWLPPLGIGFPQQEHIVPRKPFLPQWYPGCVGWGGTPASNTAGMWEGLRLCLGPVVSSRSVYGISFTLPQAPGSMSARVERLSRGKPVFIKRVPVLCSSLFTPAVRSPGRMVGLEHGWSLWFLPKKWRAFALPCHNHL